MPAVQKTAGMIALHVHANPRKRKQNFMLHTFAEWQISLLQKRGATEEYPFDEHTTVYKVGGKMFALVSSDEVPLRMTLKCDPDEAEALRIQYPAIVPGYHMSKRHWNTVTLDDSIPEEEIFDLVEGSYRLVVASLPKAVREGLAKDLESRKPMMAE